MRTHLGLLLVGLLLAFLFVAIPAFAQDSPQVEAERQDLRLKQSVLTPPELREGERRLDAIQGKAQTDPYAAQQMLQIYKTDQNLATTNRAIPGGAPSPGLVGPGDRH